MTSIQGPTGDPAGAQVGKNTLSGTVTDATTGKPISGVNIGVAQAGTTPNSAHMTTTNANGQYTVSGLSGTVNVAASRYTVNGTNPLYLYQTKMGVSSSSTVNFALKSWTPPGKRTVPANRANILFVDYDETFFECWFQDTKCTTGNTTNTQSVFKTNGMIGSNMWTTYGWSPIDHYEYATGGWPLWRAQDDPPKEWGGTALNTCIWYNNSGCPIEEYLLSSMFDIAKAYGMSTAVIGGNDYPTGHIDDANVDIHSAPEQWHAE